MCRVQFCGLSLIVDLLFQTFNFIQCVSTNSYTTNIIIVPGVTGISDLNIMNVVSGSNITLDFSWTIFDRFIFLHKFHPIDKQKEKKLLNCQLCSYY